MCFDKICLSHVVRPSPPPGGYPAVLRLDSIENQHAHFSCYLEPNRERDAIDTCASLATYLQTPLTVSSSDLKNSTLACFIFYSGEHSQIAVHGANELKVLPLYSDGRGDPSRITCSARGANVNLLGTALRKRSILSRILSELAVLCSNDEDPISHGRNGQPRKFTQQVGPTERHPSP